MKAALLIWAALELIIFGVLVSFIGLGLTLLLGLATSILGFFLLQRSSQSALAQFKEAGLQGGEQLNLVILGPSRLLAAILLILPGFFTDLIGLLLLWTPFGDLASGSLRRRYSPNRPNTIDLDSSEWRTDGLQKTPLKVDPNHRS